MQQVTAKKFADMCNVSDANIRNMIGRGKLNAIKDLNGNHLLDIEDEINRAYLDSKRTSAKQVAEERSQLNESSDESYFERVTKRIEELAREAGERKQIETNLIEKSADIEMWKKQYFEIEKAHAELRERFATIETENRFYKEQIEELKKRPVKTEKLGFLDRFKKKKNEQ